ncbi:MAG: hypothetical protein Q4A88_03845, partial [Clostridia bacterium]|nr:hypothetical protein [Clostridia bacterium]
MEQKKRKMANKTLRKILIPFMAIFLVVILLLNVAVSMAGTMLETYLGKGTTTLIVPDAAKGMDANYYDVKYTSNTDAKEASYLVARRVVEEGAVLLKNNGALPIDAGSTVVPFGYAYQNSIYGQLTSGGSGKWTLDPITPAEGLAVFAISDENTRP